MRKEEEIRKWIEILEKGKRKQRSIHRAGEHQEKL